MMLASSTQGTIQTTSTTAMVAVPSNLRKPSAQQQTVTTAPSICALVSLLTTTGTLQTALQRPTTSSPLSSKVVSSQSRARTQMPCRSSRTSSQTFCSSHSSEYSLCRTSTTQELSPIHCHPRGGAKHPSNRPLSRWTSSETQHARRSRSSSGTMHRSCVRMNSHLEKLARQVHLPKRNPKVLASRTLLIPIRTQTS